MKRPYDFFFAAFYAIRPFQLITLYFVNVKWKHRNKMMTEILYQFRKLQKNDEYIPVNESSHNFVKPFSV